MVKKSELKITNSQQEIIRTELKRVIKKVGGQKKFSAAISSHQTLVSQWLRGTRISCETAFRIENIFGVGREVLRPDLFKPKMKKQD